MVVKSIITFALGITMSFGLSKALQGVGLNKTSMLNPCGQSGNCYYVPDCAGYCKPVYCTSSECPDAGEMGTGCHVCLDGC